MYTAQTLIDYVSDHFDAQIEHPWEKTPEFAVLRHPSRLRAQQTVHGKWFGLVMTISQRTLRYRDSDELIDAINLKADPYDVEFFVTQDGFLPAYHMNKTHWITVLLDGTVPDETIRALLETSYELTQK